MNETEVCDERDCRGLFGGDGRGGDGGAGGGGGVMARLRQGSGGHTGVPVMRVTLSAGNDPQLR